MQVNQFGTIKNIDKVNRLHIGETYNISKEEIKTVEVVEVDDLAELRKEYPQYSDNQLHWAKKMLFGNCKIMSISKKYR